LAADGTKVKLNLLQPKQNRLYFSGVHDQPFWGVIKGAVSCRP